MPDLLTLPANGSYDLMYFVGLFFTGWLFGLTVCSLSCMPIVCTVVMGTKRGFKSGFWSAVIFCAGRVGGYTVVGMLCGLTGMAAEKIFALDYIVVAAGVLFVITGGFVFFSSKKKHCKILQVSLIEGKETQMQLSLLGLITGMMPCVPYTAVMTAAAASGSFLVGGFSAFCFGLGTSLSPLLLIGGGSGWFSKKLVEKVPNLDGIIRKITGVLIMIMGLKMFPFWG